MSKRLSLIMTDIDEQNLAPYTTVGTAENDALRAWAAHRGHRLSATEASALRALLRAGVEQLRESVLESAYDELAEDFSKPEMVSERRATRDRYAARSDRGRE